MKWSALLRQWVRKSGYDIVRARSSPTARRMRLVELYQIDLILDVGANVGQYATKVREMGYRGAIVSFEPLSDVFAQLEQNAKSDPKWQVVHMALGDFDGETLINVSPGTVLSSILPFTDLQRQIFPSAQVAKQETVTVRRLDSIASQYIKDNARVFLKMDTQGYEAHVLRGAEETLKRVLGIQAEMSCSPMYEGELTLGELVQRINERGFTLMGAEQGYVDKKTGREYQMDGIFFREPVPSVRDTV